MADTDKLIKLLETLKEDFEMLQDGKWDLNYSDGSEIVASLDNVEEAITIAKKYKIIIQKQNISICSYRRMDN